VSAPLETPTSTDGKRLRASCLVSANCFSQASDEIFSLSVVAGGTEKKFSLRTKKDKALRESIITKEKADLIQGTIVDLPVTMEFKDSKGVTYASQSSIDLQCQYGTSLQTFGEIFYIVQSCNLDALLRRNISQGQLKDEPSCLPLLFKRQTQGV
jgi:hypothetical protein